MRTLSYSAMAIVLMVLMGTAGCTVLTKPKGNEKMPLVFQADFEDDKLDGWQATDPNAWRIEKGRGGKVLSLFGKSDYKPQVRSPYNINIVRDVNPASPRGGVNVSSFVMELQMRSTRPYNPNRDLCVFFGYQGPTHFYYAHIADKADNVHNAIHIVDGADRVSIAKTRNQGNSWQDGWHKVKLVRNVDKGTIEVYFDDMNTPVMTAVDNRLKWGRIGVGSFDDTGQFDDIKLWGILH